jgi:hypothetical protein
MAGEGDKLFKGLLAAFRWPIRLSLSLSSEEHPLEEIKPLSSQHRT